MRPIDADAVIKNLGDISAGKNRFGRGIEAGISNAILRLENAPTLTLYDLRPKGRWVNWGKAGLRLMKTMGHVLCATKMQKFILNTGTTAPTVAQT